MTPARKQALAYVLIGFGVAAWLPYIAALALGIDVSFLPFLGAHLLGVLSGSWLRSQARRELATGKPRRRRILIGRIMVYLGVLAWTPYFALTRGAGQDLSIAPFLAAHLTGVLGGSALLLSGYLSRSESDPEASDPVGEE